MKNISIYVTLFPDLNSNLGLFLPNDYRIKSMEIDEQKLIENDFFSFEGKTCKLEIFNHQALINLFDTQQPEFFIKNFKQYEDASETVFPEKSDFLKYYFQIISDNKVLFSGFPKYSSYSFDYSEEIVSFKLVDVPFILYSNVNDESDLRAFMSNIKDEYHNSEFDVSINLTPLNLLKRAFSFASEYPVKISELIDSSSFDNTVNTITFTEQNKGMVLNEDLTPVGEILNNVTHPIIEFSAENCYAKTYLLKKTVNPDHSGVSETFIYVDVLELKGEYASLLGEGSNTDGISKRGTLYKKKEFRLLKVGNFRELEVKKVSYGVLVLGNTSPDNDVYHRYTFEEVINRNFNIPLVDTEDATKDTVLYISEVTLSIQIDESTSFQYHLLPNTKRIYITGTVYPYFTLRVKKDGSFDYSGNYGTSGIFSSDKFSFNEFIKMALLSSGKYLKFDNSQNVVSLNLVDLFSSFEQKSVNHNLITSYSNKNEVVNIDSNLRKINFSETGRPALLYAVLSSYTVFINGFGKTANLTLVETSTTDLINVFDVVTVMGNSYLVNSKKHNIEEETITFELIGISYGGTQNNKQKKLDIPSRNILISLSSEV